MKKFTYLSLIAGILFLAKPALAQTLIAVQNETSSSFYASLDSAIVHAVTGDYIYLPGGSFTISKPIDKQLQIVGVGHNPDSCAVTGVTQVIGNFTVKSGSDRGLITGLYITGGITIEPGINYYSIERCNIISSIYHRTFYLMNVYYAGTTLMVALQLLGLSLQSVLFWPILLEILIQVHVL